jgi:ribose transport system ATP-binding protein
VTFATPGAANQAGIVCIFQELSLIPTSAVADNIVDQAIRRRASA